MSTSREPGPRPVPHPAPTGARRDPYTGFGGRIGRTFGESEPAWPSRVRPEGRAPNIVVVLVDDMGYSDIGPFGAEIATPTLDRLAEQGLRLTNYHTMPLCSPARAALLTGLNPHRVGYAMVANADPGFPGYGMEIAEDIPTLAELLHDTGYATYAVGKWHLARDSASNAADDRRNWPLQKGFDQYYGVLEGLTSLFHPHQLVRDNSPLDIDDLPDGYYYTDDITDQAISMVTSLRAHDADKPFFLYVAHNAVHGPLQAKPEDVLRYRGRYDGGWDALREARFDRQLAAGLFPADTRLPRRNFEAGHEVGAWGELSPEQQRLYARYMEVYAAMVDNIDQNLGRLLDTLAALGDLDNTIVVFTSDNGGTGEGGAEGTRSYFKRFVQHPKLPADWDPDVERDPELIGGPRSLVHYPR
ncbi:sulfatase-like hydrolase/transferase, partial [Candidatus Protofrankia californiensis]|uniref:sulfatase-like hydrolase/transferase n=1 Tax=Candidatus Protofrankia californiensis TaxID=1839754 RepID=UPI0013EBCF45